MPRAPSIGLTVAASCLVTGIVAQRNPVAVGKLVQRPLHGVVDENVGAAVAQQFERDFRAAAIGRNRKEQRSALHERRQLAPAFGERRVVAAVGAIHQCRCCRRRRIVGVKHRFRRKVAGVEQAIADSEAQPDAARRVAVAAGLDRDAEHIATAANRQTLPLNGDASALTFVTQPAAISVIASPGSLPAGGVAADAQGMWLRLTLPAGTT